MKAKFELGERVKFRGRSGSPLQGFVAQIIPTGKGNLYYISSRRFEQSLIFGPYKVRQLEKEIKKEGWYEP